MIDPIKEKNIKRKTRFVQFHLKSIEEIWNKTMMKLHFNSLTTLCGVFYNKL